MDKKKKDTYKKVFKAAVWTVKSGKHLKVNIPRFDNVEKLITLRENSE